MKHAILASIGTDGDLYPFLGLGLELRRRGYRVTLATHQHFERLASDGDLEFQPLVSQAETDQLLAQRDFWHPYKAAIVVARWGARLLKRQYELLNALAADPGAAFIASPGVVAARLINEARGVPLVSVILQPWMLPSLHAPPLFMGGLSLPRWAPRPVGRIYYRLFDAVGARLMGPEFKRLRASLGLEPIRRVFQWWLSPDLVLGMFPGWFGERQPDWPPQLRLVGFPLRDGRPGGALSDALQWWLDRPRPLIAVTFGTGMHHGAAVFESTIEACRQLDVNAVLLTPVRAQLPPALPEFVQHCDFAPFQDLFPRCSAVVHHGGIGTVAKALASGTPQLILPFAFDQLDNAVRVTRLGAGAWLKPARRRSAHIAGRLRELLTPEVMGRARQMAARFNCRSGLECAADQIEASWQGLLLPSTPQRGKGRGEG